MAFVLNNPQRGWKTIKQRNQNSGKNVHSGFNSTEEAENTKLNTIYSLNREIVCLKVFKG